MRLDAELLARIGLQLGISPPDPLWREIRKAMHGKQRAAVEDPSKRKCILGGRRAGKSEAVVYWLAQHWKKYPGKTSLFIATTYDHAKGILWQKLKDFCRAWGIAAEFKESAPFQCVFSNGYRIRLLGCENLKEVERARGPHYWRVCVDECHLFRDSVLRHLLTRVIEPALRDLDGEIMLTGTPGYALVGIWWERTRDPGVEKDGKGRKLAPPWSTHHMTQWDNPFLPGDPDVEIEKTKRDNGWDDDDPELLREWYGRWARSDENLVYPFKDGWNTYSSEERPHEAFVGKTIIGVDLGYNDGLGFCVARKRLDSPKIWVPRAYAVGPENGSLDDKFIADEVKKLMREFRTHHVFVDSHGAGAKNILVSLQNYGIGNAQAAIGGDKLPRIQYVRSLLKSGNLKIHETQAAELINEYETIPWNESRTSHLDGIFDEVSDAAINALLMLSQKYWEKRAQPQRGTPEYDRLLEAEEDKRAQTHAARKQLERNKFGKRLPPRRGPSPR